MFRRARRALIAVGMLALIAPAAAPGQTPFADIATPSGPLTRIILGNELSCQVAYAGDAAFELFPSGATPGDCGTFIATGGTLFSPDFSSHTGGGSATSGIGTTTKFTPVSQSGVTGAGTSADPKRVTTVADAGSLRITQTDSYIDGQEAYRTDVEIRNTGGSAASGVIYRAGDCYLQESDSGYGFLDTGANAAGCSLNANNSPPARIEQWYPLTPGARYYQAGYSEVWAAIGAKTPFPNTCRCADRIDNGAGVSWEFNLAAGQSATFSHLTVFSPRGQAGPPPPPSNTPPPGTTPPPGRLPPAFGPGGVVQGLPPAGRCISRRNFPIRLRNPAGSLNQIVAASVRLNGNAIPVRKRAGRWRAQIDLRGLPKGRYTVKIRVVLNDTRVVKGKRRYRTCGTRRRRGRVRPV